METDDLIKALGADAGRPGFSFGRAWAVAVLLAIAVAAAIFFVFIHPRPDIGAAAGTARFLFKFVVAGLLAAAPLLLLAAVALELTVVPSADWGARLVGSNSLYCLSFIPLMGIGPLALFVAVLRHGAPSQPVLAGVVAGLAAGGIAASLYAAHCTDDSPLFVGTWYTLAIAILTVAGGFAGRAFARW